MDGLNVESKHAPDLTDREVRECVSLSLRGDGTMMDDLRWYRHKAKKRSRVTMVRDEDGRLLAWSLQTKDDLDKWSFMVYVRASHRRQGIGGLLLARARMGKRAPILVYPHTLAAEGFYANTLQQGRAVDGWN